MTNEETPRLNVRELLLDVLSSTDSCDELESWDEVFAGAPFWAHASLYCTNRRATLAAIRSGFCKSGESVLAMIEALKARAPGPREPDVYPVPKTTAIAWVWRTSNGRVPVVMERAPIDPTGYQPDQWRQVQAHPTDDLGGVFHLVVSEKYVRWAIPPSNTTSDPASVSEPSFDEKLSIPCTVQGCEASTIAECGHKTTAQELGFDLPDHAPAVEPCGACGKPKCREEGGAVCRFPGCAKNPATGDCPAGCAPGKPVHEGPCGTWSEDQSTDPTPGDQPSPAAAEAVSPTPTSTGSPVNTPAVLFADPDMPEGTMIAFDQGEPVAAVTGMAPTPSGAGSESGLPPVAPAASACLGGSKCSGDVTKAECPHHHVGNFLDACPCPPDCGCHPCPGPEAPQSYTHRCVTEKCDVGTWRSPKLALKCSACKKPCEAWDTEDDDQHELDPQPASDRCKCGCARVTHSRPNDGCSRCPCVEFRAGDGKPPEALVTLEMDKAAADKRRRTWAATLDMTKVRKQQTAKKGYRCCELCLKVVNGPVKDEKGKIVTPGDEWVAPLGKNTKRAHLACADEIALELAEEASGA